MKDEEDRFHCEKFINLYLENVPSLKLRRITIHNDIHEYNIIVNDGKVTGLIDFGDLAESALVNEIGIAMYWIAYEEEDPLHYSSMLLEEYNKIIPLTKEEVHALYYIIGLRNAMSLINDNEARQMNPNNEYLFGK